MTYDRVEGIILKLYNRLVHVNHLAFFPLSESLTSAVVNAGLIFLVTGSHTAVEK